jgi:hypothetical protein
VRNEYLVVKNLNSPPNLGPLFILGQTGTNRATKFSLSQGSNPKAGTDDTITHKLVSTFTSLSMCEAMLSRLHKETIVRGHPWPLAPLTNPFALCHSHGLQHCRSCARGQHYTGDREGVSCLNREVGDCKQLGSRGGIIFSSFIPIGFFIISFRAAMGFTLGGMVALSSLLVVSLLLSSLLSASFASSSALSSL